MLEVIYAKVSKESGKIITETLEEHTLFLIEALNDLQRLYKDKIEDNGTEKIWDRLKKACLFHDLGKTSNYFQDKIKKIARIQIESTKKQTHLEIPHNFISPAFLSFIGRKDKKEYLLLFYTIAFHHNRDTSQFNSEDLIKTIKNEMVNKIKYLDWIKKHNIQLENELFSDYYKMLLDNSSYYHKVKTDFKKEYIMMKGLFHRIDHCASAHISIEEEKIINPQEKLLNYLSEKSQSKENILKPFQKNAENYINKSIVLQASTGMGKTEFALNWIGEDKAFYVLPLKVSVNAIYERFCSIFCPKEKDKIGLLHGDNMMYGINDDDTEIKGMFKDESNNSTLSEDHLSMEEHIKRIDISRQFAMPLSVSTADQIFTSVFKWKGYEKIYATLMYSKIVIDEPQSYSPEMLAMIIKCLDELSNLGAKFCLMSATIHPKVKNKLKHLAEFIKPEYNPELKHKIKLIDSSINNVKSIIQENYEKYKLEKKKILIICNTVKKSQDVYNELNNFENVNLLHSCFIQKDRKEKERNDIKEPLKKSIMNDCKKDEFVIWISTQIVEASLDIDYDILFTETASIDALIQRMGRVFRKIIVVE